MKVNGLVIAISMLAFNRLLFTGQRALAKKELLHATELAERVTIVVTQLKKSLSIVPLCCDCLGIG